MKLSPIENIMIDAMARTFFVSAWMDQQVELAAKGKSYIPLLGRDGMDAAPETPAFARDFALMFAGRLPGHLLVLLNNAAWADVLAEPGVSAVIRDPFYRWEYPELEQRVRDMQTDEYARDFGHHLAMMGMGHGVSWFDDHAQFALTVPHVEVYL